MKNILIKLSLLSLILILACIGVYAQDSIVIDTISPIIPGSGNTGLTVDLINQWVAGGIGPIMSILTVLLGLISEKIPVLKNITDSGLRVIAIGVILGVLYFAFGGDIWQSFASWGIGVLTYHTTVRPASRAIKDNR